MNKNRIIGVSVVLLVIIVLAVSVGRELHRKSTNRPAESIDDIHKKMGIPVVAAKPVRTNMAVRLVLDAIIEPKERATVMSDGEGSITRIHVEEGDRVTAGESSTLLVELDDTGRRAVRDAANTAFKDAETDFDRARRLLEQGGISQQDYDHVAVMLQRARADLVVTGNVLSECRIYSPISGFVAKRYVDPGSVASKGMLLFEIVDISELKVEIRIPEKKIKYIRKGMKCRIHVDVAGEHEPIEVSISKINPSIDSITRELIATCRISDAVANVKLGMFAKVYVEYDQREDVVAVPDEALVNVKGKTGIYVVDDKCAVFREVEAGFRDNGYSEIVVGLSGDEWVIVDGNKQISNGDKVAMIENE